MKHQTENETDAARANSETNLRAKILLISISTILGLLIVEFAARVVMPAPLSWEYPQVYFVEDDALYFRLRPGQDSFTADKPVAVNADGIRDPRPSIPAPGRDPRVVFLGDSVTFGYGVNFDEIYSTQFRDILASSGKPVDTVNTAVPSYNTYQEVEYLKRNVAELSPDVLVLGFHWNDINHKHGTTANSQGRLVSVNAVETNNSQSRWDSKTGYAIRNTIKASRALYAAKQAVASLKIAVSGRPQGNQQLRDDVLFNKQSQRVTDGWAQVQKSFEDLGEIATRADFPVIVVIFPIPTAMGQDFPDSQYAETVRGLALKSGFDVLDLEDSYRENYTHHESIYIPYDADHPNAKGHALAGEQLAEFFLTNDYLKAAD